MAQTVRKRLVKAQPESNAPCHTPPHGSRLRKFSLYVRRKALLCSVETATTASGLSSSSSFCAPAATASAAMAAATAVAAATTAAAKTSAAAKRSTCRRPAGQIKRHSMIFLQNWGFFGSPSICFSVMTQFTPRSCAAIGMRSCNSASRHSPTAAASVKASQRS